MTTSGPGSHRQQNDGYFDGQGRACLTVQLCGVRHEPPGVEFQAEIDTGFTGFLFLPLSFAIALALPLEGSSQTTLADNSSQVMLTASVEVTALGRTEVGVALLSTTSQSILIGMDFLRQFEVALTVSENLGVVLLWPEEEVRNRVQERLDEPSSS